MSTDIKLSPQEVLELARKWQFDPVAEKQDLAQEDKKVSVEREAEILKIQEITKLDVAQTDFNHAIGWIIAEDKILDFIEEEFKNQSNPELLEQLKREKDLADKKKTTWEKYHQKNQQRFQNKTSEEEIKTVTDQNFKDELKPEAIQPTGGGREIKVNVSSKTKTVLTKTRVPVGLSGNNWRTYFIHPEQYFGKVFSSFKNSLGRVLGKKEVAGAALTKLGAFIPTGVTQAIAIASTISSLIPQELKEKLKDLFSKGLIFASSAIYFLWTNLTGLILGSAGAFLAAPFGVGAVATSFGAGFALGMGLQKIAAGIFGGGGAAGGAAIGAGAAPVIPATTISIGGFTLPAGLSTVASSFGALLSGSGLSSITLFGVGGGISLISIFTALTIITVGATQDQKPVGQNGKIGFKVELIASPEIITASDPKEEATVTYIITITKLEDNVEIKSVNEKISKAGVVKRTQSLPITQTQSAFSFKAGDYDGSRIISAVTVTGRSEGATEDDTQTATAVVSVGNVSANQPYGYPVAGKISSLDLEPCSPDCHFGTFLPSRAKVWGGMDIAQSANNPVYSTIEGVVDRAEFDNALGGVIYLRSFDGQYKVAYLHLDNDLKVKSGDKVGRGTLLGKVYAGLLPTSTGPHVHYQVLLNNGNQLFQNNFGSCLAGKILPGNPRPELYQLIVSSGPFVCQ